MRFFLFLLLISFSSPIVAQFDSSGLNKIITTYKSHTTISRADIERLPATSFLELVQGAFPFITSITVFEEYYTFIVNGFIGINPNAISISQIEQLTFYPAGTAFTKGSLAKRGTFVVITRTEQNKLSVSTKSGIEVANPEGMLAIDTMRFKKSILTINNISSVIKKENYYISSAVLYQAAKNPQYTFSDYQFNIRNSNSSLKRITSSNFAGYKLNKLLSIEGGLLFALQPKNLSSEGYYMNRNNNQLKEEDKTKHYSAHARVVLSPSNGIKNLLQVEVSEYKGSVNLSEVTEVNSGLINRNKKENDKYRLYSFSNNLYWQVNTSSYNMEVSLLTRYMLNKAKFRNEEFVILNQYYQHTGSTSAIRERSFQVAPNFNFNWKQIIFSEFGATYEDYQSSTLKAENGKFLPNAGIRIELASLLKNSVFSSIELSTNYNQYIPTFEYSDRLERKRKDLLPGQLFYPSNMQNDITSTIWLNSIAASFLNNKFSLKANYYVRDEVIKVMQYPFGGSGYINYYESLSMKGLSFESKAEIYNTEETNINLYAAFTKEKYKLPEYSFTPYEEFNFDAGKAPWRASLRTNITVNHFFLQASALLDFNAAGKDKNGNIIEDKNLYRMNFLLFGYKFPLGNKSNNEVEINAQSRNLFFSNELPYQKYYGVGLNVSL